MFSTFGFRSLATILLFVGCLATFSQSFELDHEDVIIPPLQSVSDPNKEACLIIMQGADIPPSAYTPLAQEIQKAVPYSLWVGIPEYYRNETNPLVINQGIERVTKSMEKQGMKASLYFYGGHSLGGAMIQLWTEKNYLTTQVNGQILMGSFLTRTYKKDYIFSYPVPTLTVGGELDGLARVTRIAEAYYTQLEDPEIDSSSNKANFPVTVIEGLTHMQFASGPPPDLVMKRDLLPEISYEEAHKLIARDVSAFIVSKSYEPTDDRAISASATLSQRLDETDAFVSPIVEALHYEGYHNFRPPCLCLTDTCEPMNNCTSGCPFTRDVSQATMGIGPEIPDVKIENVDSFHDVWETQPEVHLPAVSNSCSTPDASCTIKTTTVTQGVYHTGEDLEIWKKHFDVPGLDTGYFPVSAVELRTKMSSREHIYTAAGVSDTSFEDLDGGGVRCGEINQASIDWANARVAEKTMNRFKAHGQPYTIGQDKDVCPAGPCWIWQELKYIESEDASSVSLVSPQFSTSMDFKLKMSAGFHYCKVLSPARSVEWMYVDGLRAHYSLNNPALSFNIGSDEKKLP